MPPQTFAAPPHPLDQARDDAALARDNADKATTVPGLKAEVVRLAGALEAVVAELERRPR